MKKFIALLLISFKCFSQNNIINVLKEKTNSSVDTIRYQAYSDLIWELKDVNKADAINYANKFINETNDKKNKKWLAQAYNDYGIIALRSGNFPNAENYIKKSLAIRRELKLPREIISSLSKLGNISVEQGKFSEAIKIYLECTKISEQQNYFDYLAAIYGNISSIYSTNLNQYDLGLVYAKKAIIENEKSNNTYGNGIMYSAIGSIFSNKNQVDSAIFYYKLAKKIVFEKKAFNEYCTIVNNLGQLYKQSSKGNLGIAEYKEAAKIARQIGDSNGFVTYETNLAAVLTELGRLNEAEEIYKRSVLISEKLKNRENLLKIYKGASILYTIKGNKELALNYLEKYINLNDTIFSYDVSNKISKYQTIYETEKKENKIKELNLINTIANIEKQNLVKQTKFLYIIFISILFFFSIAIYLINKIKKSKAALLQQKNISIASFKAEQIERERIAKELHDGIAQKLSVMTMQLSLKEPNIKLATEITKSTIQDVRNISHNLMPANIKLGLIKSLEILVEELNTSVTNQLINLSVDKRANHIQLSEQNTLNIYRIIQEFIQNSLKYANANLIEVKLVLENNYLVLTLSDNGIGFNINDALNKNGIGLSNIKNRVEQLGGKISMKSSKENGTHFKISIEI